MPLERKERLALKEILPVSYAYVDYYKLYISGSMFAKKVNEMQQNKYELCVIELTPNILLSV